MRSRLLTTSAAVGLTVTGIVAITSAPAGAATTSVAVPVSCHFAPVDVTQPRFTTTVTVTAPSSVRPGRGFEVRFRVVSPIMSTVPVALYGLTINSTFAVAGARPSGPITLVQGPVDVPKDGSVQAQTFTRRFTAGSAGSTVSYAFGQYQYAMFPGAPGVGTKPTSTCLPDAGRPITVATTRVTGWFPF
jgi:hypothetical protein